MAFTDYKALDFSGLDKSINSIAQKQTLASLGQGLDGSPDGYAKAGQALLKLGDVGGATSMFALSEKARERTATDTALKSSPFYSGGTPVAPSSPKVAPLAALGQPNDVENQFIGTVKQAGLTNPIGLGAVAAYGKAESGFNPQNVNRVWNDPSQSGQPGQAGGIMSWREDRLRNLQAFAKQRGEDQPSVQTQALFLAQEDKTLLPRLEAAKTPEEANQIMANAWRFAGYNQPGGENARRLALTQQYAQRYGQQQPQMAAQPPQGIAQPQGVQVAETEADVQRLEAQQAAQGQQPQIGAGGTYAGVPAEVLTGYLNNPRVPENLRALMRQELASRQGGQAPVQVAEAAPQPGAPVADVPAPGAANAQFAIPGNGLPPNDPYPNVPTQQLYSVLANPRLQSQHAAAKQILDNRLKYTDENAPDKRELTRLQTVKLRREVEGEGARPMTAEERQAYSVPEGQPAYMNGKGEPKFGPASTKITNSIGATEGEYAKANGKAISKRFEGIVEEGDAAQTEAGLIARIRDLGGSIKNMGGGAALQARLAEIGIKVGENVSEIEAYSALIDKLTPQQRVAGAGATSDFDAKMFKNSLPGLVRTPQGNAMILDTLEAVNTYKRQRADIVAEAMANNEKPSEVIKKLKELPDPYAAFKDARKASMQGSAEPTKADPGAGWQDLGGGIRIREKR